MERDVMRRLSGVGGGLDLVERSYPAGLRMGRHSHGVWRYCLVLRGSYTVSWRRGHRTRAPGHLGLHPADEVHTSAFHDAVRCFHVVLPDALCERLLNEAGIAPEPHEFLGGRAALVAAQMHDEFRRRDDASSLVLEGLAYELLGWSARAARREAPGASWVHRARELLRDRFAEPIGLAEVAREVGVHPVHLARQFRRTFGCSVGEYVRRARLEYARRALDTGASLGEIATRAGFADQSHFTRLFKRETGLTPRQYRLRR